MIRCRGIAFADEDDAYEYFRQRDIDEENPMNVLPEPQACHACTHKFIGVQCPICKEERPAFAALKKDTESKRAGVQPVKSQLPACRYAPEALCDCAGRGLCLDVA